MEEGKGEQEGRRGKEAGEEAEGKGRLVRRTIEGNYRGGRGTGRREEHRVKDTELVVAEPKREGDEKEDDGGNVEEQEEEEAEVSSREAEVGDGEAKVGGSEEEEEVGGTKELEAEKGGKEEEGEKGSSEGTKELGSSNTSSSRPPRPQQQPQVSKNTISYSQTHLKWLHSLVGVSGCQKYGAFGACLVVHRSSQSRNCPSMTM
ncbi:hypothetical protein BYT27DRAFT_7219746 [Phlegmacium glaucopus]|nr:hypothetical protein BYT27DRAFT_7219746 [Phlegmacium glaucopus]